MSLLLGIDTGGTYTDAVIYEDESKEIRASAKALTTHDDLAKGVSAAITSVVDAASIDAGSIALVGLSTTLATNALTEGRGGTVALVSVGFDQVANSRPEIVEALGDGPLLALAGGHNADGSPICDLDTDALGAFVSASTVDAFAVVSQFSVRNPNHELEVARLITDSTSAPVTVSHELSPKLGGPKRAATTILNARLMALISDLLEAVRSTMDATGVVAPLMIVRGDGSMLSDSATSRTPIETILSGPAASVIGAAHLVGQRTALVADIGGTTTDVAVMTDGYPKIATEGARVGGQQTLIEAISVTTIGLGGDSSVSPLEAVSSGRRFEVGPGRVIPLSILAATNRELVIDTLTRQSTGWARSENFARFVVRSGHAPTRELSRSEAYVWDMIADGPAPMDTAAASGTFRLGFNRLAAAGLVRESAFSPTDAAHVLGTHTEFDSGAAKLAADLLLQVWTSRGFGPWADVNDLCSTIVDSVTRQSAELFLGFCLESDGLASPDLVGGPLVQAALDQRCGLTSTRITLDLPIVGLGASAGVYHRPVAALLGTEVIVPRHAPVANAIGAVVGQVRTKLVGTISQPTRGTFATNGLPNNEKFHDLEEAREHLLYHLTQMTGRKAEVAGAASPVIRHEWDDKIIDLGGKPYLVESRLTITSAGRPRLAAKPTRI